MIFLVILNDAIFSSVAVNINSETRVTRHSNGAGQRYRHMHFAIKQKLNNDNDKPDV